MSKFAPPPFCKGDAPQIEDWGSCHEVTEGADYRKVVGRGILK